MSPRLPCEMNALWVSGLLTCLAGELAWGFRAEAGHKLLYELSLKKMSKMNICEDPNAVGFGAGGEYRWGDRRENVPFIWAIETGIHKQPDWFRCVFLFPDVL